MPRFVRDDMTLREARAWLAEKLGLQVEGFPRHPKLGDEGLDGLNKKPVKCPLCGQPCKVYHRAMTAVCAMVLIMLERVGHKRRLNQRPWIHLPSMVKERLPHLADQGGYRNLGVHWGLLEEELTRRPDGGRAGVWRLTIFGRDFVLGTEKIPKYAYLYNNQCLTKDGPMETIQDVLARRGFNYDDLMRGE